MYCILDTTFNRNLLQVLSLSYEDHDDGFLRLKLDPSQEAQLRMWHVDLIGPVEQSALKR
jgi:hypothetical protein